MLDRAGDPAGDVDVGRDACTGLADLVGVVSPSEVRDRAAATDNAGERRGELQQRRKPIGRADAPTAADDHGRRRQRDAGGALDAISNDRSGEDRIELDAPTERPSAVAGDSDCGECVMGDVTRCTGASNAHRSSNEPPHRTRTSSPSTELDTLATIGRSSARGRVGHHLVATIGPGRQHDRSVQRGDRLGDDSPHASGP